MSIIRRYTIDQSAAVNASGGDARTLKLTSCRLVMDASWAPYVQAELGGAVPSAADLTAIDPRKGWRSKFRLRTLDASGTQLQAYSFDLGIRTRRRTFGPQPGLAMSSASIEALLQEYPFGYGAGSGGITKNASAWASDALAVAGYTLTVISGAADTSMGSADTGWTPDVTVWDYVAKIAEAAGARIYADESGTLIWASPTYTPTSGTTPITGITNVDDTVSRDDPTWANYAVVAYSGSTSYVTSDSGLSPRKGLVVTRSGRQPGSGNAAAKIRTTAQSHGRTLVLTAIADLSVRPLQSRSVAYQGQSWTGVVQNVAFELPAGQMTVTLNVVES